MRKKLFFGEYLIKKGLINEEDILEALKYQKKNTPPFEKIACKLSLLTIKDIFQIFTLQAGSDLTVEEVALKQGYLTAEQIASIREKKEEMKPFLGEALIAMEKISPEVLQTELDAFNRIVKKYQEIREILKNIHFFRNLDENALEALAYIAKKQVVQEEERVISEGDRAECFYCVVSGFLRITKAPLRNGNREVYITMIGKNDVFGEAAIFEEEVRTANVTAESESVLLRFERDDFVAYLNHYPKAAYHIFIFIINRLLSKLNMTNRELAFERRDSVSQDEVDSLLSAYLE